MFRSLQTVRPFSYSKGVDAEIVGDWDFLILRSFLIGHNRCNCKNGINSL